MSTDRGDVIAELAAHPGEGHRSIASRLGTSASSVDRACRAMREPAGAECVHGRLAKALADVSAVTPADTQEGMSQREIGEVLGVGQATVHRDLAPDSGESPEPEQPEHPHAAAPAQSIPDSNESREPEPDVRPDLVSPQWPDEQAARRSGAPDLLDWAPPPADPALLWRCEFCHWKMLREAERCEQCGWPAERQTPR